MRIFAFILVVAIGCSANNPVGELPPLHPTTGKVVRNKAPVTGGLLQFRPDPDTPNLVINAEVSADGSFELQTTHATSLKKGKGAPQGSYFVSYLTPTTEQSAAASPFELQKPITINAGVNQLTIELPGK